LFGLDELGLDLGTSVLHIVVKGKGVVLSDPAYVAYERESREVTAVGEDAWRMYGKTPETMAVERPMRQGHIRSFDLVSKMLHNYLRKLIGRRAAFRPRLILALPSGVVPSERQTLIDICVDAGVRSVMPVDESVLSAIGCGMDIAQHYGRMNVDIGGGRTSLSVFSLGKQIVWMVTDVAGDRFDDAVIDYMRRKHNLLIGERSAENLKIDIGSARVRGMSMETPAYGRSLVTGLPKEIRVTSEEMTEALEMPLLELANELRKTIERTPPELASDIFDNGIVLCGGGARLYGLDDVLSEQLQIPIKAADEPELSVCRGIEALMMHPDDYEDVELTGSIRESINQK